METRWSTVAEMLADDHIFWFELEKPVVKVKGFYIYSGFFYQSRALH